MSSPDDNPKSKFVPNSYQTPNVFVDDYMAFLTGEQWKILSYALRRILGFQKRQDRISVRQFQKGATLADGSIRDYGTGMSFETCKKCLDDLARYGLMVHLDGNNPQNEGALWGLQWDSDRVNEKEIMADFEARRKTNRVRTKAARKSAQELSNSGGDNEDEPEDMGRCSVGQNTPGDDEVFCGTEHRRSVGQNTSVLSDRTTITSRNTEENQINILTPNGVIPQKETPKESSNGIPVVLPGKKKKKNDNAAAGAHRPVRTKLTQQQLMVGALGRIFRVDPHLNGARYGRLARDLVNSGYKPVEIQLWYSPEDAIPDIRSFFGDEAVDAVPHHAWYYKHHWAWLNKGSIPNEALFRQSLEHAKTGYIYPPLGEKEKDASEDRILSVDEMKEYVKKQIEKEIEKEQ